MDLPELITTTAAFQDFLDHAATAERYAIDTEFHREKTYFPKVALVQMATEDRLVLIDPLAVDLTPMADLLTGPGVCVLHAAQQDLEVLLRACGVLPREIFDTQVAAGFLGMPSISLASLLSRYENVQLAKGSRLTDWLRRPLTEQQLTYAAADVEYLLSTAAQLQAELIERGRLDWLKAECDRLLETAVTPRTPEQSLKRIKEARSLKGQSYAVGLALVEWRETRAAEVDIPVRSVLNDMALAGIAQQSPGDEKSLREIRGVDSRVSGKIIPALLKVVQTGLAAEAPPTASRNEPQMDRSLRPVVSLVTAWVSQVARSVDLDPALLATRSDVEAFLTDGRASRLDQGWRNTVIGGPIRALVEGEAALAFNGAGELIMERRSNEAFETLSSD